MNMWNLGQFLENSIPGILPITAKLKFESENSIFTHATHIIVIILGTETFVFTKSIFS